MSFTCVWCQASVLRNLAQSCNLSQLLVSCTASKRLSDLRFFEITNTFRGWKGASRAVHYVGSFCRSVCPRYSAEFLFWSVYSRNNVKPAVVKDLPSVMFAKEFGVPPLLKLCDALCDAWAFVIKIFNCHSALCQVVFFSFCNGGRLYRQPLFYLHVSLCKTRYNLVHILNGWHCELFMELVCTVNVNTYKNIH